MESNEKYARRRSRSAASARGGLRRREPATALAEAFQSVQGDEAEIAGLEINSRRQAFIGEVITAPEAITRCAAHPATPG